MAVGILYVHVVLLRELLRPPVHVLHAAHRAVRAARQLDVRVPRRLPRPLLGLGTHLPFYHITR